jgi:hypothetical protein
MQQNIQEQQGSEAVTEPFSIILNDVDGAISSLSEFERVLKPRTAVPSQRYARFLALDDETLANAAVTTRYAADHLKRTLQDLRGRAERVDAALSGMEPSFFTQDHDWRGVFDVLLETGLRAAPFKLVAMGNYRRYLLHCLDALNQISADRLQSALYGDSEGDGGEESTVFKPLATQTYDSSLRREEVLVRDLVRLPKGTTLSLQQGRDGPFEIWLGKRRFRVEGRSGTSLVDEQGNGMTLHDGRNVVGRALYNDVIVDADFTDVSRRHLILDLADGAPSAITDLSSAGTFIARSLVNVAA